MPRYYFIVVVTSKVRGISDIFAPERTLIRAHDKEEERRRQKKEKNREKQRERERINIVRTEGSLDVRVMFNVNSLERHSAGRRGFARSTS